MPANRKKPAAPTSEPELPRISRSLSLMAQTEATLRQAIAGGQFPSGRLPTEVELAEQLGVSRETVRLATEVLQREGLLRKIRRRGTFLQSPEKAVNDSAAIRCLGYLQADYSTREGGEEAVTATISGLMLQGAIAEASRLGFQLLAQHTKQSQLHHGIRQLYQGNHLEGVVFASCGEEKAIKRAMSLGLPVVVLDHDLNLPRINSVRDDSFAGACLAIRHLAALGHRRIAFVHWQQSDLNPWRLRGYRQGLRDTGLPRRHIWEIPTELTETGARHAVQQFLQLSPRPTALFCFNNTLGRFVIEELTRQGVNVPADVSVMGAGGEAVPGLTCTAIDWREMGRIAVQILQQAAQQPERNPEHRLLQHTLNVGRTAARLA